MTNIDETIHQLPVGSVSPHPENLRNDLGDLDSLITSIRTHGILEPLLVRPTEGDGPLFQVVAGHRRLAAALDVGLDTVPCITRDLEDDEVFAIMLVENLRREDIDPVDEARGYFRLVEHGWTQKRLAEEIGTSKATVSSRLKLLSLPAPWLEEVRKGGYSLGDVDALVKLTSHDHYTDDLAEELAGKSPADIEFDLEMQRVATEKNQLLTELKEQGETIVETEWRNGRYELPRNHRYIDESEHVSSYDNPLSITIDQARADDNLGWVVLEKGYGANRKVYTVPVCTDVAHYTRKSSSIPDEERPEGWFTEQEAKQEARERRERRKQEYEELLQRVLTATRAAKKTELEDIVLDRVINNLTRQEVARAADLFDVMVVYTEDEAANHYSAKAGDMKILDTEQAVRERSRAWQFQFVVAALLSSRANDELAQSFLDSNAPTEDS